MLITDLKGRAWWCPDFTDVTPTDIRHLQVLLSESEWREYQGSWNINPGARND